MRKLDEDVLARIAELGLKPRPYILFLGRSVVFWSLAGLSVLLGAASFAVVIFAVLDYAQTGGRGLDEMPFDDVATALPAIWGICCLVFAASAWLSVSRTRRGYRFRPLMVIALAIAISIGLGTTLYVFDAGRNLHEFIAAHIPAYERYTTIPYAEWSRPDLGFLGGQALSIDGSSLSLEAFDGTLWSVDMAGAVISTDGTPVKEGDVAIRGTRTGPASFKAISIAPFD